MNNDKFKPGDKVCSNVLGLHYKEPGTIKAKAERHEEGRERYIFVLDKSGIAMTLPETYIEFSESD